MTYYLYHIPGKKIGMTRDLKQRVEEQQGYGPDEYDIIMKSDNINYVSEQEIYLQKLYGYKVDETPYNKLKCNEMNINITEQTTTFPCPVNKLKGQLMDNMEMEWETEHGKFKINKYSIDWIMRNVKSSMYNDNRSYVYNKAFARFYENHQTEDDQTRERIKHFDYPGHVLEKQKLSYKLCYFDLIREWAEERGLYEKGDPKTQYLKLMEEAGEVGRAILKNDKAEIVDGIGDMVVVLTNLAKLTGHDIEFCIEQAYNEISKRKGKMINGTFVKDE